MPPSWTAYLHTLAAARGLQPADWQTAAWLQALDPTFTPALSDAAGHSSPDGSPQPFAGGVPEGELGREGA